MTTTSPELDEQAPEHDGHTHGPSDGFYFKVFWILVAITVLEVTTYWWDDWFKRDTSVVAVPLLLFMMVVKFGLVASFFMHLRFDSPLLKRTFYFGLGIAVIVYVVALSAMNIWTDNGNPWFDDPPPDAQPPTTLETPGG